MNKVYEIIFYTGNSHDDIYHIYNTIGGAIYARNIEFYTEHSKFCFTKADIYENKTPSKKNLVYNEQRK